MSSALCISVASISRYVRPWYYSKPSLYSPTTTIGTCSCSGLCYCPLGTLNRLSFRNHLQLSKMCSVVWMVQQLHWREIRLIAQGTIYWDMYTQSRTEREASVLQKLTQVTYMIISGSEPKLDWHRSRDHTNWLLEESLEHLEHNRPSFCECGQYTSVLNCFQHATFSVIFRFQVVPRASKVGGRNFVVFCWAGQRIILSRLGARSSIVVQAFSVIWIPASGARSDLNWLEMSCYRPLILVFRWCSRCGT